MLGLILNEVVTNAGKHAYADGRSGTLRLAATASDGAAVITVADDGPGMREEARNGLGRTLIGRLARRVRGVVEWADAAPGTRFSLSFPVERS